jgi:hypothetical protein
MNNESNNLIENELVQQINQKETNITGFRQELNSLDDSLVNCALTLYDNIVALKKERDNLDNLKKKSIKNIYYKITGKYTVVEAKLKQQYESVKQMYDDFRKPVQEIQEKIRITKNSLAMENSEAKKLKETVGKYAADNTETNTNSESGTKDNQDISNQKITELKLREKELSELVELSKRAGDIAVEIMQKMKAVNEYIDKEKAILLSNSKKLTFTAQRKTIYDVIFDKSDANKNISDIYLFMCDMNYYMKEIISKMSDINSNQLLYAQINKIGDNGIIIIFIEYFYSILCTSIREKDNLGEDYNILNDIYEKLGKNINEVVNIKSKVTKEIGY